MKKSWFGYGLLVIFLVLLVWVWRATGDLVGTILSLVVLALGGGLIFVVLAYVFSNVSAWFRRLRGVSWGEHLKRLEANGEAVREEYEASQALTVEELNTSSLMHFVDLGGGKILCLIGQQYYEFEPINDDPEVSQPRQFPTENFSLLRHAKTGEVLSLFPGSEVIEPTICAPVVWPQKLYDLGFDLRDGEVVSGSSMDAVERIVRDAKR